MTILRVGQTGPAARRHATDLFRPLMANAVVTSPFPRRTRPTFRRGRAKVRPYDRNRGRVTRGENQPPAHSPGLARNRLKVRVNDSLPPARGQLRTAPVTCMKLTPEREEESVYLVHPRRVCKINLLDA